MPVNSRTPFWLHWLIAATMVVLTTGLGYFTGQHEFWKIIGFYVPFFSLYLLINSPIHQFTNYQLRFWLAVAILLRLILVFSMPGLSNDVFRFIWDGRLLVQGYNPFDHLPLHYLDGGATVEGIDRGLFEAFDAKNTYTVYPPVAQAQFGSACWLFPKDIYWCTVVMKLWLFAFEAGSIFLIIRLLRKWNLPARRVLLYALNPLIIFEITGNLHFEGAMIFFLLLALWLLSGDCRLRITHCEWLSAAAFAMSVCSKLLTLMFLPFFIKKMGWGRSLHYYTVVGVVTVLLFLPVVNATFLANFGDSLNLYFQKLEYNASLYYLLRWVGWQVVGYNLIAKIGPALGLAAAAGILWLAFRMPGQGRADWQTMMERWLFAICLYLACTTTVHPWYVALPVVLCIFTKWRFPIVWSALIFLTYINYSYEPYRENLWVVALEYTVVGTWFLMEWRSNKEKALSL